jgi:transcriptional regulator with GAF, ATPase, and Fis domain/pSer/pThr/pTyr-binding forkhead associated (FHA) protein
VIVLEILKGTSSRRVYESSRTPLTIGRSSSNDVVLSDYHLSGEHAQIARGPSGLLFRDLKSTNGSIIERGGQRLTVDRASRWECQLKNGDVLSLGDPSDPVRIELRFSGETLEERALDPKTGKPRSPSTPAVEPDAGDTAPRQPRAGSAADEDDEDLADRLIASRSIVDLPAVTTQLEDDPAVALRVYKALQPLGARLDQSAVLEATVEATFALLPRATHVAVLLRSDSERDRFVLAISRARGRAPTNPAHPTGPAAAAAAAAASKAGARLPPAPDSASSPAGTSDPVRASRAVLRRVLSDRAAVLTANAQEELSSSESIIGGKILSMLAVPLWRGDDIIGLIQADNRHSAGMFAEEDLEVALILGAQAALAIDNAALIQRLRIAEERLRGENVYLRRREGKIRFDNIIGEAPAMKVVLSQLERVIDTRATVCIAGETGTGKELIASAVHNQSQRRDKMFVAQNCAALPENLLESELFGHRRGAFTSADSDKKGLFEIADGGTLFLDEMGEMPLTLQAKLLRVLQEGTIRPVGATAEKQVDVRIICATNRDLAVEVEQGRFRQDLYYRLMVFPIVLPPLRDRREDIPALAAFFLKRYAEEYRAELPGFSQEALDALSNYAWPGNIRELENEIQRLVIQCEPAHWIEITDLSPRLRKVEGTVTRIAPKKGTLREMVEQVERWLITEALRDHGNNKTKTAATLGITREGLHKKLAKFGL